MAITAVLEPGKSDDHFLQQFDSATRFCLIPEHYNTNPMGWPNQKEYLHNSTPLPEQLMLQRQDVQFITNFWREDLGTLPNVHYHGFGILNHHRELKRKTFYPDKHEKLKCANLLGGRTRINRTLASHWLAKNYNLDELITNWVDNNDLSLIQDVIKHSPYFNKSHIKTKLFLKPTWQSSDIVGGRNVDRCVQHFVPNLFNKSLLSIVVETMGIEMNNDVDEKTLYTMSSRCLVFHTGCYQIDDLLKRIGFNVFDDIFDLSHCQIDDRYALTIMGFENNKEIIQNNQLLQELWHSHHREIEHNFTIACRSDHLENYFKSTSTMIKEACKHIEQDRLQQINADLKATPLFA